MTRSRRDFLWSFGGGLGGIAFAQLLAEAGEIRRFAEAACRVQRRAAPPRQGQARHSAVHERRRQPDGHVRLQARARTSATARSSTPAGEQVEARHQRAGQPDEVARSRSSSTASPAAGSAASSRTSRVRRRPGLPDGDGVEDERPRPGQLHDEHRLHAARLPVHGGVAQLRPGPPDRQPADVRRAARPARPAVQQQGELLRRASCRSRTRARSSTPAPTRPIPDLLPRRRRQLHHARQRSATAWTCSAS